jgi:FimV-like protein
MKRRYDFSKGVRGKFYKPDAVFRLPVYLDKKVEAYLTAKADTEGMELSDLVNDLLNKEIVIIKNMNMTGQHWNEAVTKLDLARAFIDMGDVEGARAILDEILKEKKENENDKKHEHGRTRKTKSQ